MHAGEKEKSKYQKLDSVQIIINFTQRLIAAFYKLGHKICTLRYIGRSRLLLRNGRR